jgi:hypothetical protein
MNSKTIYLVSCSHNSQRHDYYFGPNHFSDAISHFASCVVSLDIDEEVGAAWASIGRLPDLCCPKGNCIAHWTKISDERPVFAGYETLEEALNHE